MHLSGECNKCREVLIDRGKFVNVVGGVDEEVPCVQASTGISTAKLPQRRESSPLLGRNLRVPQTGHARSLLGGSCLLETSCCSSQAELEVVSTREDSAM